MGSNTAVRCGWSPGECAEWGGEEGDATMIHNLLKYFFQKVYQCYDAYWYSKSIFFCTSERFNWFFSSWFEIHLVKRQ